VLTRLQTVCAKARYKLDSLGLACTSHVNICAARYNKIIYKALSTGRSVSITRAEREVFYQLQFERNVNIWLDNSGLTSWKNCWFNRYIPIGDIETVRHIVSWKFMLKACVEWDFILLTVVYIYDFAIRDDT